LHRTVRFQLTSSSLKGIQCDSINYVNNVISRRTFYEYVKCEKVAQTGTTPTFSVRFLSGIFFFSSDFVSCLYTNRLHLTSLPSMNLLWTPTLFTWCIAFSLPWNLYLLCVRSFFFFSSLLEGNYTRSIIIIHCRESNKQNVKSSEEELL